MDPGNPVSIVVHQDLGLGQKYLYLQSDLGSMPGYVGPNLDDTNMIQKVVETKESARQDALMDQIKISKCSCFQKEWDRRPLL